VSALRLTAAIRLRMLNYLQRLILILPFNAPHADSFTSFMIPVETSTTPYQEMSDSTECDRTGNHLFKKRVSTLCSKYSLNSGREIRTLDTTGMNRAL
jgi:hypothetical protein